MTTRVIRTYSVLALLGFSLAAGADLPPEQIARLGADLTPLGGERAGNAEGTIPAWDGGITAPPPQYRLGMHHPDPFADDPILFTITRENLPEHADRLTAGHRAMLETHDSFYLNVYPTRRSASAPQYVYDGTREVAATASLTADGNGVEGAVGGVPFPIPASGLEVLWNHVLRYRGTVSERVAVQAAPTRTGDYTLVRFQDEYFYNYYRPEVVNEDALRNTLSLFLQRITAPARLAGTIVLVQETLNQNAEHRRAWVYNPGQRRVRRAPNIAFDNPGTASDGMRTNDQLDMFNGSPERYDFELLGKRELYVPYNAYRAHSDQLRYADLLTPLHLNPQHLRYELHRVWVVEARLKSGARHLYKRRTFYVDEDSWQILVVDQYDNRDQIWRVSEAHVINYYEVPLLFPTIEVHTDLQAGRYLAIGLNNEDRMIDFALDRTPDHYTPAALRQLGVR